LTRFGVGLALLLATIGAVQAQPAPPTLAPQVPVATNAPTPAPARPHLVRRSRRIEEMPHEPAMPLLGSAQAATLAQRPAGELAPMPNRDIEAPVNRRISMEATLMPEVFRRQMPGRGMTAEGVSSQREERVYAPAPGARLTVPFFTR
jgi:hypothetical protein